MTAETTDMQITRTPVHAPARTRSCEISRWKSHGWTPAPPRLSGAARLPGRVPPPSGNCSRSTTSCMASRRGRRSFKPLPSSRESEGEALRARRHTRTTQRQRWAAPCSAPAYRTSGWLGCSPHKTGLRSELTFRMCRRLARDPAHRRFDLRTLARFLVYADANTDQRIAREYYRAEARKRHSQTQEEGPDA